MIALYPNSTHILQPLDVGVFGPLKTEWRKMVEQFRINHHGNEITKFDVPSLLSKIIQRENFKSNVKAGFRKSGIFPFDKLAIDYTKILNKSVNKRKEIPAGTLKVHIEYFESEIESDLVEEFRMTKRRNHPWEGLVEAELLFETWLNMQIKYEAAMIREDTTGNMTTTPTPVREDIPGNISTTSTTVQELDVHERLNGRIELTAVEIHKIPRPKVTTIPESEMTSDSSDSNGRTDLATVEHIKILETPRPNATIPELEINRY